MPKRGASLGVSLLTTVTPVGGVPLVAVTRLCGGLAAHRFLALLFTLALGKDWKVSCSQQRTDKGKISIAVVVMYQRSSRQTKPTHSTDVAALAAAQALGVCGGLGFHNNAQESSRQHQRHDELLPDEDCHCLLLLVVCWGLLLLGNGAQGNE